MTSNMTNLLKEINDNTATLNRLWSEWTDLKARGKEVREKSYCLDPKIKKAKLNNVIHSSNQKLFHNFNFSSSSLVYIMLLAFCNSFAFDCGIKNFGDGFEKIISSKIIVYKYTGELRIPKVGIHQLLVRLTASYVENNYLHVSRNFLNSTNLELEFACDQIDTQNPVSDNIERTTGICGHVLYGWFKLRVHQNICRGDNEDFLLDIRYQEIPRRVNFGSRWGDFTKDKDLYRGDWIVLNFKLHAREVELAAVYRQENIEVTAGESSRRKKKQRAAFV